MHLIMNDGEGDWREVNEAGPRLQAVTAADVRRVAREYLTRENRTVAIYTRKPGTEKEPAAPPTDNAPPAATTTSTKDKQ